MCKKDGVTDRLCGAYVIDTSEDSGATREGKIEWVTLAADPEDVKELLGASGKGTVSLTIPATARGKKERRRRVMKAIWLACCACGDYGLLQREVEGRDTGAQVLRVGDLDGLVSMARAFPSRRGAAIIAASLFDTEDVRKTVARLTAEGRVSRVVVLIEALDPSDIEGLFRAGATEVIAAHSICGNGRAGEGAVDSDRCMTIEPDAFVDRGTRGASRYKRPAC